MSIFEIIFAGGIVFLAGLLQSIAGFGGALFAVPLLLWIGIPLPNVVVLVCASSMLMNFIGTYKLRADVPWRISVIAAVVQGCCLVAGVLMLKRLVVRSADEIRLVVGGIVCVLAIIQLVWRPKPVDRMHWGWGWAAFVSSGFIGGLCGMSGPPLVLWSMAHTWSARKTRGFLFAVFAISSVFQISILYLTFGESVVQSMLVGLLLLPFVYLGLHLGLPVGNRMNKDVLRRIAYLILLVLGISAVLKAVW